MRHHKRRRCKKIAIIVLKNDDLEIYCAHRLAQYCAEEAWEKCVQTIIEEEEVIDGDWEEFLAKKTSKTLTSLQLLELEFPWYSKLNMIEEQVSNIWRSTEKRVMEENKGEGVEFLIHQNISNEEFEEYLQEYVRQSDIFGGNTPLETAIRHFQDMIKIKFLLKPRTLKWS